MGKQIVLTSEKVEQIIWQICSFAYSIDSFHVINHDAQIKELAKRCENVLRILVGDEFSDVNIEFILDCVTDSVNELYDQYNNW